MQLARLTTRRAGRKREAARAPAAELWVVEDAQEARETAADRLVFEAPAGRFLGPLGPAEPPGQVELVRFLTAPGLVPADAIALHARGVRWRRAAASWNAATIAALEAEDPALGFVDEIWGADRSDLIRPARSPPMIAA
jgi:hypothetical protein